MRVELANLEGRAGKFAHDYTPGELVLNDDRVYLAEPPKVSGRIIPGAPVVVFGQIAAGAQLECDRCLKPITMPVNVEFGVEYVTAAAYHESAVAELRDEELALSVFDGEVIDVDEMVREQVLLAVPSYALCRENCKGLCPLCRADRNLFICDCKVLEIDPRWMVLKELVKGK